MSIISLALGEENHASTVNARRTGLGSGRREEAKAGTGRLGTRAASLRRWTMLWAALAVLGAATGATAADLLFQQVAAGHAHTVAVKSDGTLWA